MRERESERERENRDLKEIWSNLWQEGIWRDRKRSDGLKEKEEVWVCRGMIGGNQRQLLNHVRVPWWRSMRILLQFLRIQPI